MNNLLNSIVRKINFDFVKNSKFTYSFSVFFILAIIVSYFFYGINFGIDFTGGQIFEIKSLDKPFDSAKIRKDFELNEINDAFVQNLGNENEIIIRLKGNNRSDKIKEMFSTQKVEYKKIDFVGAQISSEFIVKGVLAVFLALLGMFFYLLLRFNWSFALSGVICLIHDVIFSIGLFVVTQMEFNIPSIAAILTIIGYSINDSVVIFDRIREYLAKRSKKYDFSELVNQAIHSTLIRTSLTSFTTMLAALPLVILGKSTLHDFSLVILFGVFIGTYSSIFIAGPLVIGDEKLSSIQQ
ncbi:MAG: protein translocase subunit SecF [Rickettsiaceae bacterium H1]|nr:protein translocase subunit SecF [Rickettsiaceae bacterium H1]